MIIGEPGAPGLENLVNHLSSLVLPPQLFSPPVFGLRAPHCLSHRGVREAADEESVVFSKVKLRDLQRVGGGRLVSVSLGIIGCRHLLDYYLESQ